MPYVFQTINKRTGEAHRLWRFQYYDHLGRKRKATGTANKKETEKIALQVQARQYAIRNGVAAVPKPSDTLRDIDPIIEEYLRWGQTQGGRRGHPWGAEHVRKRRQDLAFWKAELKLKTQFDLLDCQQKVERVIHRNLVVLKRTGKTAWNRVEGLAAFCRWCVDREYLADDPLRRLKKINTEPVSLRRALNADEIQRLLKACLPEHVLIYEVAICTGLRVNEMRHITPAHLDGARCAVRLESDWTKNRRDGFQPIPVWLMAKLLAASKGLPDNVQLLAVQKANAARILRNDLRRAGIPEFVEGEGKVVFHSLRMSFCTLLDLYGASAKETMLLARHSTPQLTMGRYVKPQNDRLSAVVDAVGNIVHPDVTPPQDPNGINAENETSHKVL